MRLIAKKPCSFGGIQFYIGDEVPADLVLNPSLQVQMGVLIEVPESGSTGDGVGGESGSGSGSCGSTFIIPDSAMTIVVQTENGTEELEPTDDGIQQIFTALIGTPTVAEAVIKEMDDEDALILLHMADRRKSVREAAMARASELSESAGEQ